MEKLRWDVNCSFLFVGVSPFSKIAEISDIANITDQTAVPRR